MATAKIIQHPAFANSNLPQIAELRSAAIDQALAAMEENLKVLNLAACAAEDQGAQEPLVATLYHVYEQCTRTMNALYENL